MLKRGFWVVVFLGLGCTGPAGTVGPQGPAGNDGDAGPLGPQGPQGLNGNQLSDRARQGFLISPVAINLSAVSQDQLEAVGRGSYIVNAVGFCNECHGGGGSGFAPGPADKTQYLAGGTEFDLNATDRVFPGNLTPDPTTGLQMTEAQFIKQRRTGVDYHNTAGVALFAYLDPWMAHRWMTTDDLKAIYAYLQVIPAIKNAVPLSIKTTSASNTIQPLADPFDGGTTATYTAGAVNRNVPDDTLPDPSNSIRGMAIQPLATPTNLDTFTPQEQASFGAGSYIVNAMAGCEVCHSNPGWDFGTPGSATYGKEITANYLTGGAIFVLPPGLNQALGQVRAFSRNLTGAANGYNTAGFDIFAPSFQQGLHYDLSGAPGLGWPMPYWIFRDMLQDDLEADMFYITHVPRETGANDKPVPHPSYARFCAHDTDCKTGEHCATATNECIGGGCATDQDCGACQHCLQDGGITGALECAAPLSSDSCLTNGI